ncbi:MAG: DegT/DnrJ/EryC1/StrS family aminotransferase [Pseudomonadota bacterium]
MSDDKTYVTRPFLPPLEDVLPYIEQIWEKRVLTNNGPLHQEFEARLAEHLEVDHIALFANGTLALVTALQALRVSGEVITTPYSFAATSHALLWNNLTPRFVDIDPQTCNMNPELIEQAITPQTSAILPVHCYGNPCDVERMQEIADIYGLKVIYDAAHAFGVYTDTNESICQHGDLSTLSFHATKVFNTFEGGALVCSDAKMKQRIDFLKNFGFADETTIAAPGINGKMNEFSAALGLVQLKSIDAVLERRRELYRLYKEQLAGIEGIRVLDIPEVDRWNAAYMPVFVEPAFDESRDELYFRLQEHDVNGRRYFYPLLSDMPMYRGLPSSRADNLPCANRIAEQIICLPIFPELHPDKVEEVCGLIRAGRPSA